MSVKPKFRMETPSRNWAEFRYSDEEDVATSARPKSTTRASEKRNKSQIRNLAAVTVKQRAAQKAKEEELRSIQETHNKQGKSQEAKYAQLKEQANNLAGIVADMAGCIQQFVKDVEGISLSKEAGAETEMGLMLAHWVQEFKSVLPEEGQIHKE